MDLMFGPAAVGAALSGRAAAAQRRIGAHEQPVLVAAGGGIPAGIEPRSGLAHPAHGHVVREDAGQAAGDALRRHVALGGDGHHLSGGVHTRVGPSGDDETWRLAAAAEERLERGLEVATGRFGAMMQVELVNDGPFTILLEA